MAYEPKDGDGVLFKEKDPKSDRAPAYTGYITAHKNLKAGERVRLAAWVKGGLGGKDKFLSLKMDDERGRDEGQRGVTTKTEPEDAPF